MTRLRRVLVLALLAALAVVLATHAQVPPPAMEVARQQQTQQAGCGR